MDILSSSLLIIDHFRTKTSFKHNIKQKSDDFRKVVALAEDVEVSLHSFKMALDDMVESKLLKSVKVSEDETLYILLRPLATMNQTLEVSFETACYLAQVINNFNDQIDCPDRVDPTRLTEGDLKMAADLIDFLSSGEDGTCAECGGPLDDEGNCSGDDGHDLPKPNADGSMPIQKAPVKSKKPKPGEDDVNPSNN